MYSDDTSTRQIGKPLVEAGSRIRVRIKERVMALKDRKRAPAPTQHQSQPRMPHSDVALLFRSVRKACNGTLRNAGARQRSNLSAVKAPVDRGVSDQHGFKSVDGTGDSSYMGDMNGALNIYTSHFGLTARPFTLVPDPDFLFWSAAHTRAYTMLEYGTLTGSPITLITGEVGAGKTTLLHKFLKGIGDDVKIGLVSNASGSRGELLRWVLMALDQPADRNATYVDLFDAFQRYLIEEYSHGHRVILIIDEAQNLSIESLEELRMFTNINSNKDELLQLVLVGQPELRDTIRRPDLKQFAQRIAASFHLNAMNEKTVISYIAHRLRVAGASRNLFAEAACKLIHQQSGGVPRLVNQLCDLSMVYAFTKDQKTVTLATVQEVLDDGTFFAAGSISDNDERA
ncbi:MAG: ExeA family protein [Pseudomonadota bacterium]|uniref:ExeA family protein n=1 Tax=Roseovarius sp. TaxID=1486281 RepID=UPI003561685A